jgi:hypothetical protein
MGERPWWTSRPASRLSNDRQPGAFCFENKMLEKFERRKQYRVLRSYTADVMPGFWIKTICYSLAEGDVVRFVGNTLGYATFRVADGRNIYLKPRLAFRIIGGLDD